MPKRVSDAEEISSSWKEEEGLKSLLIPKTDTSTTVLTMNYDQILTILSVFVYRAWDFDALFFQLIRPPFPKWSRDHDRPSTGQCSSELLEWALCQGNLPDALAAVSYVTQVGVVNTDKLFL